MSIGINWREVSKAIQKVKDEEIEELEENKTLKKWKMPLITRKDGFLKQKQNARKTHPKVKWARRLWFLRLNEKQRLVLLCKIYGLNPEWSSKFIKGMLEHGKH